MGYSNNFSTVPSVTGKQLRNYFSCFFNIIKSEQIHACTKNMYHSVMLLAFQVGYARFNIF